MVLGLPLIGSHLAQFAIMLTDAIMLGWYDVRALAAEVLAHGFFFVFFIMLSGFAWAVMPMVAAAAGSGETAQVRRVTRMGLWLSLIAGVAVLPVFIWSRPILLALGQDPELSAMAQDYLRIAGPAILPALVVMVLKSYFAALERTQVVLWVTVAALPLNAFLNWLLIFGNAGAPEMGIRGAAVASVSVHLVSMLVLIAYAMRATPEHALFQRFWRPDREAFGTVFRLGWPIGLTGLAEVGLFTASSLLMGMIGTLELAAHGIALQIASATFMIHLGLSNAATIRAGRAYGARDAAGLARGGAAAIALSAAVALATVALFLTLPEPLLGAFLDPADPDRATVVGIGVGLLAAAALFQLADAAQVMALGLLRGVQDTRVPMVMAAVSYWVVGLSASYGLGFLTPLGGVGIWLGLALGLAVAAVLMMGRFWLGTVRHLSG